MIRYNDRMTIEKFHPLIRDWFASRFDAPTEPQALAWPNIAAGRDTLIAAPTGSGKTLSAFLVCFDSLLREAEAGELSDEIRVVYVSPLRALSNDIERNLNRPLSEIRWLAEEQGLEPPNIRAAVRTGDTTASQRAAMLRKPPHILVTTPESLYLLLTSEKAREKLRNVQTVIVDEIHALARDKRGSHLTLTLERLNHLCCRRPQRIGLSATQRPMEAIASFLTGCENGEPRPCEIIDAGHVRDLDVGVFTPPTRLEAVCSNDQWAEVYDGLATMVEQHRSTLIFVNTRRLAERVSHHLREVLGEDAVASHHGSLAKETRHDAEQRLKNGQLKAIVATASLEMGIDIGYIDLVCQIGSPRAISTFLQRVGRSGHSLGKTPKGRLFPLTRDQLLECLALVRAVKRGRLDAIEIPREPLDILIQQIIAAAACDEWDCDELYAMCRGAEPFSKLPRDEFNKLLNIAADGIAQKRGAYLHYDRINERVSGRRGARLAAITSGGAIPETAEYRVVTEEDRTVVGSLDEDFAIESQAGDVFLLGNTSWRVRSVRNGEVNVSDAHGAPPSIPFWFGEAPGRTVELSHELSDLRSDLANENITADEVGANEDCMRQASEYLAAQKSALGVVPTATDIVFERFFDESGGMQLVIHAPLGSRINRAWGLALRKRFCRSFDFELQAAADDNGVLLSMSPQHSFPVDRLFKMLHAGNARDLLEQALLAAPMFQVRWRWNVTRALAVLRRSGGKKVPPHLQRFRSEDLLSACFPETVGCLENHHGPVEIPDHPLVRQTMFDCLHEAMDIDRWLAMLDDVEAGRVRFIAKETREPSPFAAELLNANPYAFLDDAPLEERRTRAISTRRGASADAVADLARLDPDAIRQVVAEAWPQVRDPAELHDALMTLTVVFASEIGQAYDDGWRDWMPELVSDGRANSATMPDGRVIWFATENSPLVEAIYPQATFACDIELPKSLQREWSQSEGWVELVRGRVTFAGPTTAAELATPLGLTVDQVFAALESLEAEGLVLRGRFSEQAEDSEIGSDDKAIEWCERRLLARIHRLTLDGLRRQIQPVSPESYVQFLAEHHHLTDKDLGGPLGAKAAIARLQGFQLAAGSWEGSILPARVSEYETASLDQLFMSGELVWGRLQQPQRSADDGPLANGITRTAPIALMLRSDVPWLLPQHLNSPDSDSGHHRPKPVLRGNAEATFEALQVRGALFFQELAAASELLPTHLEESLRELAAHGLVTADGFGAVRAIVAPKRSGRRNNLRGNRRGLGNPVAPMGRWSLFPGPNTPPEPAERIERWCMQLLDRYGVVFRDLLTRETAAPPWWELVRAFRRLELRGRIRGGRFVSGVGGEQFATDDAVSKLRKVRDREESLPWLVISAVDPLNLSGIVTDGPRITANHKNRLILLEGRCVASLSASEVTFHEDVSQDEENLMRKALITGKRDVESEVQLRLAASQVVENGNLYPHE